MKNVGDALASKILLTEIREGRISNAIEVLEFSIDCSVVVMGQATNRDTARQQQTVQVLQMIKQYRDKYPREVQTNVHDSDSIEEIETAKRAVEILSKMP